jgi:predicted HTH transcriptional regulator
LLRRGVVNLLRPRVVSFYRLRVVNLSVFSTKVIDLFKANQKLSHVEIERISGVNRKTIAKYIDEFLNE